MRKLSFIVFMCLMLCGCKTYPPIHPTLNTNDFGNFEGMEFDSNINYTNLYGTNLYGFYETNIIAPYIETNLTNSCEISDYMMTTSSMCWLFDTNKYRLSMKNGCYEIMEKGE